MYNTTSEAYGNLDRTSNPYEQMQLRIKNNSCIGSATAHTRISSAIVRPISTSTQRIGTMTSGLKTVLGATELKQSKYAILNTNLNESFNQHIANQDVMLIMNNKIEYAPKDPMLAQSQNMS